MWCLPPPLGVKGNRHLVTVPPPPRGWGGNRRPWEGGGGYGGGVWFVNGTVVAYL